jgi:hypothetical protein
MTLRHRRLTSRSDRNNKTLGIAPGGDSACGLEQRKPPARPRVNAEYVTVALDRAAYVDSSLVSVPMTSPVAVVYAVSTPLVVNPGGWAESLSWPVAYLRWSATTHSTPYA